jgi:hypothetical protein
LARRSGVDHLEIILRSILASRRVFSELIRSPVVALLLVFPGPIAAQTDYYNTDAGRPITVEDAYATERYAFELQLAPLRLERSSGGLYTWEVEPEISYGIFPRTHIEVGVPIAYRDRGPGGKTLGAAGLDISMLHNLNAETSIPALGVAGELLLPFGGLAPENAYFSAKGIATRTFTWARVHLNARYTFGEAPEALPLGQEGEGGDISRWLLGLAIDKASPLRSMLVTAESFVSQPIAEGGNARWNVGAGIRYQASPRFALDGGVGKRLSGDDQGWFVTFGMARAFAIRSLLPGARARSY